MTDNGSSFVLGESIGHKRIQQFDRVKVQALRLKATQSVAPPIIKKFAVYNIEPLPPDPTNPATIAQSSAAGDTITVIKTAPNGRTDCNAIGV